MAQQQNSIINAEEAIKRGNILWFKNKDKTAQHWYITFCLLMSAAHDHLTGVSLFQSENLNWSITANYYSMVHSARLLCFLEYGDFPMSHKALQKIFNPENNGFVMFDWLRKLYNELENITGEENPASVKVNVSDLRNTLDPNGNIGCILGALGKLRNESNYEALLIANEKNHIYVTERFQELARLAQKASDLAFECAINQYTTAVNKGNWEHWGPLYIAAESNEYVRLRMLYDLRRKFGGKVETDSFLSSLEKKLIFSSKDLPVIEENNSFEEAIRMEFFNEKMSLMQAFENKINDLRSCLCQERPS